MGVTVKGEAYSHKCSKITGIKICNPIFHKEFGRLDIHVQVCNKVALAYLLKMSGNSAFKNQQVNLELSAISSDHNY